MAVATEVDKATASGLSCTHHIKGAKGLKSVCSLISEVTAKVGTGGDDGYKPLSYLDQTTPVGYNKRVSAQKSLCQALRAARVLSWFGAALQGNLLLVDFSDTSSDSTCMYDPVTVRMALSLLQLPDVWARCRRTQLHIELAEQNAITKPVVHLLSPSLLPDFNQALFELVRVFSAV